MFPDNRAQNLTATSEDAPAPSALHSFKAHVEDGKILVTADPGKTLKNNMSRQPKLLASAPGVNAGPGVVIVGGGSGAFHAVESLREVGSIFSRSWEMS